MSQLDVRAHGRFFTLKNDHARTLSSSCSFACCMLRHAGALAASLPLPSFFFNGDTSLEFSFADVLEATRYV